MIEKTRGIIGAEQLKMMKNTAMLINCARGGLVDEAALYDALKQGEIAKAALDVYETEPPKNSPLFELDNITFTPHLGASTREAQVAVSVEIAIQAVTYLKTGEAINALNLSTKISAEELKKSRQFMMLAKVMGKLLVNLAGKPIEQLEVSLFGTAAEVEVRPITIEALVGVLEDQFSTPVNSVNAGNIAKKQGVSLVESRSEETQGYLSLVKLVGHCGEGKTVSVAGTLLGDHHPRIVNMNQFEIEVVPEGTLLITEHNDKPGVISAISAVLGESNINISRMQVGVPDSNDKAMAVISVSSPLSDALLQKVKDLSFVNAAVLIDL
jgi:D-3-phosphoglycerate dehydrogenase